MSDKLLEIPELMRQIKDVHPGIPDPLKVLIRKDGKGDDLIHVAICIQYSVVAERPHMNEALVEVVTLVLRHVKACKKFNVQPTPHSIPYRYTDAFDRGLPVFKELAGLSVRIED